MVKANAQSENKSKFKKFQYLFLFFFLFQSMKFTSLYASTIYTTSILDNLENESIFFHAIKSNDLAEVRSLINSGYDVNERNKNECTPLMAAVYKGNIEMINLLVSAGADLESFDNHGNTPFMYAFYGAKEKKAEVEFLLSLNVNTEIMNSQEQTPLILATLNNHCHSLELLINAGVKIETKGKSGATALMHAAGNQNIGPAKLLIKSGAELETRNDWSFTPLMLAAFKNDGSMIRVLLKAGANINACTIDSIPINLKKNWLDFNPKTVYIPSGSTALDIAKQFENRFAENILINSQAL